MYTANHVIPLFSKASPGWKTAVEDDRPSGAGDIPGIYGELSDFARYMLDLYNAGDVEDFPKIFNTLELFIQEGDEKARELVMMGFIEVLQSISAQESSGSNGLKKWLREESLKAWNEIERFWRGKESPPEI